MAGTGTLAGIPLDVAMGEREHGIEAAHAVLLGDAGDGVSVRVSADAFGLGCRCGVDGDGWDHACLLSVQALRAAFCSSRMARQSSRVQMLLTLCMVLLVAPCHSIQQYLRSSVK